MPQQYQMKSDRSKYNILSYWFIFKKWIIYDTILTTFENYTISKSLSSKWKEIEHHLEEIEFDLEEIDLEIRYYWLCIIWKIYIQGVPEVNDPFNFLTLFTDFSNQ